MCFARLCFIPRRCYGCFCYACVSGGFIASWAHVVHTKFVCSVIQLVCAAGMLQFVHVRVLSGVGMWFVQISHIRSLSMI